MTVPTLKCHWEKLMNYMHYFSKPRSARVHLSQCHSSLTHGPKARDWETELSERVSSHRTETSGHTASTASVLQCRLRACSVDQKHPTLWDPMDCIPLSSSVHGSSQVRILEWVAISSSRGPSQPRDRTQVSCTGKQILYRWATWEALRGFIQLIIDIYFLELHFI